MAKPFSRLQTDGDPLRGLDTDVHHVPHATEPKPAVCSLEEPGARFLMESQNPDGGWGFHAAMTSATEPTAWAVMGLEAFAGSADCSETLEKGIAWLEDCQLKDGSWPAHRGQHEGCWVTSAACLALASNRDALLGQQSEVVAMGLHWLFKSRPGAGNAWWRLRRAGLGFKPASRRDPTLAGWSWTPGTSSWVEPTAQALLAFQAAPGELLPRGAQKRVQAARAMLLVQALPTGGWNSGGSDSYGYAARPQPVPTAWALMALWGHEDGPEITAGIEWLRQNHARLTGFFSLSLGCLCLNFWGVQYDINRLQNAFFTGTSSITIMEMGWALLAISAPQESPLKRWRKVKT